MLQIVLIKKFASSAPAVLVGSAVTLSWDTSGATAVTLAGPSGNIPISGLNGTVDVTISSQQTATFTLSATGPNGSSSCSIQVIGVDPAYLSVGTATYPGVSVTQGQVLSFCWNIRDRQYGYLMRNMTITAPNGAIVFSDVAAPSPGFLAVYPTVNGHYTLQWERSINGGLSWFTNTNTASTVYVSPQPYPTINCTAPAQVLKGTVATVAWDVWNADSVSMDNGIGAVGAHGSFNVRIDDPLTLTITASNAMGQVTKTIAIGVFQQVAITSFTADPASVPGSGDVTLTWTTAAADSVTLDNGIGAVALNGSKVVTVSAKTTFTLSATGNGNTVTAQVTILQKPRIDYFTATPSSMEHEGSVTLSWGCTGANITCSIDQGIGVVTHPEGGSVALLFKVEGVTEYTLTATNEDGSDTAVATVTVDPPPLAISTNSPLLVDIEHLTIAIPLSGSGGFAEETPVWSATGLPAWLQLDSVSGLLSGAAPAVETSYSFTIHLTSPGVAPATPEDLVLRVGHIPVDILTSEIPPARQGSPYQFQLRAEHGNLHYAWSYTGDLPPGLTLSVDGLLSGTPLAYGYWTATFQVASAGDTATLTQEIMAKLPWSMLDPFRDIFYRILNTDGTPVVDANGKPLCNDPYPDRGGETVFGRMVIAFAVGTNDFTVADARVRGGGLDTPYQPIDPAANFWDLGYWDGKPFPLGGGLAVYLPQPVLDRFSRDELNAKLAAILPPGALPLVRYYQPDGQEGL